MSRKIAVVGGTGPAGMGLAERWARAGESIIIGSRDAERAREKAAEVARKAGAAGCVEGMENAAAVAAADLVVLTVPFAGHAEMLQHVQPHLRPGITVIDATVPLAAEVGGKPTRTLGVWQGSAAEQAAELVPEGVTVAAAFQNISADVLAGDATVDCDVIVCSDDARVRRSVMELAEKIPGVRGVDGGRLENARIVEQLTALLITINIRYKAHGAGLRITGLPPR